MPVKEFVMYVRLIHCSLIACWYPKKSQTDWKFVGLWRSLVIQIPTSPSPV